MVTAIKFTQEQEVKNNVSSLRNVSNALGVISNMAPLETAAGGEIKVSSNTIICEDSVKANEVLREGGYITTVTDVLATAISDEPGSLAEILEVCEGKDVCINVISKSGTTTEPAIAFRIFRIKRRCIIRRRIFIKSRQHFTFNRSGIC